MREAAWWLIAFGYVVGIAVNADRPVWLVGSMLGSVGAVLLAIDARDRRRGR